MTKNSNQTKLTESLETLRVHIAPIGFEVDRIIIPAKRMKADRVWLIVHSGLDADKGEIFTKKVSVALKDAGIECQLEPADRTDLFDTLRALNKIIHNEYRNTIFVNVSVGSKIQSIACTMMCMMFKDKVTIRPYYAIPEQYKIPTEQESRGVRDIISLPDYKIEIPSNKLVECLKIINGWKGSTITKKVLRDKALEKQLIHVEKEKNRDHSAYMALNKNLIEPLLKWKLIDIQKPSRNYVISLTDDGRNVLRFLDNNF